MKITGAIFDMDGTLLDSMYIWDTAGSRYLRTRGIAPRADADAMMRDMSLYQAACYCQEAYGVVDSTDAIMAQVNAMVEREYREVVPLKPGVAEFLARLERQGVVMAIATATDRPLVEAALTRLGIQRYFAHLFTCTEVGHGKDEPHIYEAARTLLGTARAETPVFEDALYAARTAKVAGFPVVAVRDASERQPEVLRALSDIYIEDFTKTEAIFA